MIPIQNTYPLFEANQVLSNEHLNNLFAYLDEQERLTRTNLIGIGIVCGLVPTVAANGSNILISKGCGVTSEGFFIVWDNPQALEYYKPYTSPEAIAYATFMDSSVTPPVQFPLWELTPDHNNDPSALPLNLNFLRGIAQPVGKEDEKILILFLECKAESNKNCSPNSCDDKGAAVTATVRPLLIRKRDMDAIQAKVRALGDSAAEYLDMAASTALRFNLPELRLRRYDVENSNLVSTDDLFNAYQRILNKPFLDQVADAFSAAYTAFKPVLQTQFVSNPFATLKANWAYLHNGGIITQEKYLWYQYYYDHIDTLIQAYNEFRERGLEVIGICCPDARLFPRHLMLNKALPGVNDPAYRHHFMPSPLFSRLHGALADLQSLFARLVTLITDLELPPVITVIGSSTAVKQIPIRITPSKLGSFPLSDKAIPYHYKPDPLFRLWDYRKNRQNKAHQNLSYRAASWNLSDDFVLNPLRYDIEPNNFLRIEGHLGRQYESVLQDLLFLKSRYRLPVEFVALKTGRISNNIELPDQLSDCHFQDLDTLYATLREGLLCNLCEEVIYFYNIPVKVKEGQVPPPINQKKQPLLELLKNCAPHYQYTTNTLGDLYEQNLAQLNAFPYPDLNQFGPNPLNGAINLLLLLLQNNVPSNYIYHILFIYYFVELSETLPEELSELNYADFENKYQDLVTVVRLFNDFLSATFNTPADNTTLQEFMPLENLQDHLDHLLFACKLEPIQAVKLEYQRRMREIREMMLFSIFMKKHPGLQHKAGVPLGGTFVIVYHGDDQSKDDKIRIGRFDLRGRVTFEGKPLVGATVLVVGTTVGAATNIEGNFRMSVSRLPAQLRVTFTGLKEVTRVVFEEKDFLIIDMLTPGGDPSISPFSDLSTGEVIADFYLPYLCCSDCQPIQFVLPKSPPIFVWRQMGCTSSNVASGLLSGQVSVTPSGGTAPYQYSANGGVSWTDIGVPPVTVNNNIQLTVRDAEGTVSAPQAVTLRPPVVIVLGQAVCNTEGTQFTVQVTVSGGLAPYRINSIVSTSGQGSVVVPSGKTGEVVVQDSSDPACETKQTIPAFTCPTPCNLPCKGIALDCGHLLWVQPPSDSKNPLLNVRLEVISFTVSGEKSNGGTLETKTFTPAERKNLTGILNPDPQSNNYPPINFHTDWGQRIKTADVFIKDTLAKTFGTDPVMQWNYDAKELPGFATLRIERFECHTFAINIRVTYSDRFEKVYTRDTQYLSGQGTLVKITTTNPQGVPTTTEAAVKPFNCLRRNRCLPNAPAEALCKEKFDFKIEKKTGGQKGSFSISPAPKATDNIFWEFGSIIPTLGKDAVVDVQFPGNGEFLVRVLIVRPDTCVVVQQIAHVVG